MQSDRLNILPILFALTIFIGCAGKSHKASGDSLIKKGDTARSIKTPVSNYSKKSVDSLIKAGVLSADSVDMPTPSQEEERENHKATYNQIMVIDSVFTIDEDTLHFHSKYYCLKNVNLVVSKSYDWNQKNPKEFITHPFASDILLIKNKDTVLNKQFTASDFAPFYKDNFGGNLKKYGSIMELHFLKSNRDKNKIVLGCSLSIPATDIGIPIYLIISKDGDFKGTENL